jgi:hypothetical protein
MRLYFGNMARPRLVAKALRKAFATHGREHQLAECQEIAARMFGYANWHELGKLHGAGPVSVDDAQAPSHAGYRRQHYASVLRQAGVPDHFIGAVLDAVRPSDRTAGPEIPTGFPRLLVEAFETDASGERIKSLGGQDLTRVVIDRMRPYAGSPIRPFIHTISSLHNGLSEEARGAGYDGRLSLPGLTAAIDAFVKRVGGPDAVGRFKDRLDQIQSQARAVEEATLELARIRKADFSNDFSRLDFVYLPRGGEYLADFGEAYAHWDWDNYVARHPRPPFGDGLGFGGPKLEAWQAAYAAFVREAAPPYVYATTPVPWKGVDAADIRNAIEEEDDDFDVDNLLSSEMDEHYEDAYSDIVDPDVLQEIAETWAKGGDSTALDREVAAWNAKQSITSYYPDYGVALPAFPGKTKADAIAWCEADLAAQTRKFAELHAWTDRAAKSEPEPAGP